MTALKKANRSRRWRRLCLLLLPLAAFLDLALLHGIVLVPSKRDVSGLLSALPSASHPLGLLPILAPSPTLPSLTSEASALSPFDDEIPLEVLQSSPLTASASANLDIIYVDVDDKTSDAPTLSAASTASLGLRAVHANASATYKTCFRNMSEYDGSWKDWCLSHAFELRQCRDDELSQLLDMAMFDALIGNGDRLHWGGASNNVHVLTSSEPSSDQPMSESEPLRFVWLDHGHYTFGNDNAENGGGEMVQMFRRRCIFSANMLRRIFGRPPWTRKAHQARDPLSERVRRRLGPRVMAALDDNDDKTAGEGSSTRTSAKLRSLDRQVDLLRKAVVDCAARRGGVVDVVGADTAAAAAAAAGVREIFPSRGKDVRSTSTEGVNSTTSAHYSYAHCSDSAPAGHLRDEKLWECGRYRLLRDYGGVRVALLLPKIEGGGRPSSDGVDLGAASTNNGSSGNESSFVFRAEVGQTATLRLAACGAGVQNDKGPGGCDTSNFNASGLVIWARFRGPKAVFATMAEAIDCRSWRVDYVPPVEGRYTVDIVTAWYSPGTLTRWGSGSEGGDQTKHVSYRLLRGETWEGGVPLFLSLPHGRPLLHGAYERDGRWMPCDDWCQLHRDCIAWTRNDSVPNAVGIDPRKCMLYSSVNGTTPVSKGIHVISGERRWKEPDVTYLGGLSVKMEKDDEEGRKSCRASSHVWGSPVQLIVEESTSTSDQIAAASSPSPDNIASLPSCTRTSMASISQEGVWAAATLAYPELAAAVAGCLAPCTRDPGVDPTFVACTPNDTLPAGICAIDDATPVYSGWHTGALYTAEKPLRGYAWVERSCRHRMWSEEDVKSCLRRMKVDVVFLHGGDVFADLLDRWKLGRVEAWDRRAWVEGFKYEPGVDLLLPTNGADLMPHQLFRHLNATVTGQTGGGTSSVAIIIQHMWPLIVDRMYGHHFSRVAFEEQVEGHIAAWQEAQQDPRLSSESRFVVILSPLVHEFFGAPYYTLDAVETLNRLARPLYEAAGWDVVDAMAITRARPDYRVAMEWWNAQSHLGEKRSGNGVVHAITNTLFTSVCG